MKNLLKKVYNHIPLKKNFFTVAKTLITLGERIYKHLHFHGDIKPVFLGYSALSNSASTTYISMFAAIFSVITNIALNVLLIPKFGIAGCAWATVITYFVGVLTYYLFLHRSIKIPISWIFQAMLPLFFSTIVFALTRNPIGSLADCLILSLIVNYFY